MALTKKQDPQPDKLVFSIVIPVYNRATTILPTLHSVVAQCFSDFECIIVDDGSQDREDLLMVVSSLNDRRFRCIHQENAGASAARNTGVSAARGKYIAFLDSDDYFLPSKLEKVFELAKLHPDCAIYSRCNVNRGVGSQWVRPDRAIGADEDMAEYLFIFNQFIPTCSLVLPIKAALDFPFDPALKQIEDPDLCFRLHRGGVKFLMIDEPLAVWNDVSSEGRLSQIDQSDAPFLWLESTSGQLSKRIERGFRATVLAYYLAPKRPFRAFYNLMVGLVLAQVPARIIARQMLRCFMPRKLYRTLVNFVVAELGKQPKSSN